MPLIRSLLEPLVPLSAGSHRLHLAAAESAYTEPLFVAVELDPLAEEVGGCASAPVGTGGAVVPVAGNFAFHVYPNYTPIYTFWVGYPFTAKMIIFVYG